MAQLYKNNENINGLVWIRERSNNMSTFGNNIPLPFLCELMTRTSNLSSSSKHAWLLPVNLYGMHLHNWEGKKMKNYQWRMQKLYGKELNINK